MATKKLKVVIPEGLDFSALHLYRDPITLALQFDWAPIEQLCAASNIDIALFRDSPEDNVAGLVIAWYFEHRTRGGDPDPVAEQIIAEVEAESVADIYRIQSAPGKKQ